MDFNTLKAVETRYFVYKLRVVYPVAILGAGDTWDEIDFFDDLEGKGPGSSGTEVSQLRNIQ